MALSITKQIQLYIKQIKDMNLTTNGKQFVKFEHEKQFSMLTVQFFILHYYF